MIKKGRDFLKPVFLSGLEDLGEGVEIWEAEIVRIGEGWQAIYEARILRTRPGSSHIRDQVVWTNQTDCFELAQGRIERFILGNTSESWNYRNVKLGHPNALSYISKDNWRTPRKTKTRKEKENVGRCSNEERATVV